MLKHTLIPNKSDFKSLEFYRQKSLIKFFLGLFFSFLPLVAFADIRLTQHQIKMSDTSFIISDDIELTVEITGKQNVTDPSHYALDYFPKQIESRDIKLINVKIDHTIEPTMAENTFHFKLRFIFRALKVGVITIPNFQIGFKNLNPFLTIPKRTISVYDSLFSYLTPFLMIGAIILILIIASFGVIHFAKLYNTGYLEIKTYHKLKKLVKKKDEDFPSKANELLNQYLKKRYNIPLNHEKSMDLPFDDVINTKLNRFGIISSNPETDQNEIKESFKTLLFLFQNIQLKDEQQYETNNAKQ